MLDLQHKYILCANFMKDESSPVIPLITLTLTVAMNDTSLILLRMSGPVLD